MIDVKQLGKVLVTGGTGFLGSYLTKALIDKGAFVRVFDNNIRGSIKKLGPYLERIEYIKGDVTDFKQVYEATKDIDTVFHLAFINGTENFYKIPGKILEVGVKGAINTLDAAIKLKVSNYVVTSSSEVYQEPTQIPTKESERIIIPDIKNPRFSYSGGKIITELLALHYTADSKMKTVICRPHNFYGADMGVGHVVPQFILRMKELSKDFQTKEIDFPIQGSGEETRAFCYVDDAIEGLLICAVKGEDKEIYHIGSQQEVKISNLALLIAEQLKLKVNIKKGKLLSGGTLRRCPCIDKIKNLGYNPTISLSEGLKLTIPWYLDDGNLEKDNFDKEIVR